MRIIQPRPTRKVYYSSTEKRSERIADQTPGLIVEGGTMDRPLNITYTEPTRKHEYLHINSRQWAEVARIMTRTWTREWTDNPPTSRRESSRAQCRIGEGPTTLLKA